MRTVNWAEFMIVVWIHKIILIFTFQLQLSILKYIDISTSHNISIRYELANTATRILAWGIDMFFLVIYSMLISFVAHSSNLLYYTLLLSAFAFYHLGFEVLNNGQSPGKMLLKIKVVTLHGRTAKAQDYFLRWVFRLLEIAGSLGIIASLYISSTEKNQRIGDMLARTTVIKLRSSQLYNLNALVKMGAQEREITYSGVTRYNDHDMMLVKDAIRRHKKHPNDESRNFIANLSKKIAQDLGVSVENVKFIQFLETVLYDYISLTR